MEVFKYNHFKNTALRFSFFKKYILNIYFFFSFFLYFFGTLKHLSEKSGSIIEDNQNNKKFTLKKIFVKLKNE